jgi:two-component system nitrogen regulation sensor histidine kinase GlnL
MPESAATGFERLFGALATAVVVLDSNDCVSQMNTAAEGLLGISLQRAYGKPFQELAPGLDGLSALCKRARAAQQSFGQTLRIMAPQRDGTELELAVKVSPANDGRDDMLLVELFDITQRHHLDKESALVAQRGASRRMLQQLAHEIRNPLGGLRGAAQLLERELKDPSLHEFTQVIIGEADRLESLVAGLLGPGARPDMHTVNLHEVLEYVARIVCSEEPEIELQRDYDPSLPDLLMDRDQLTQAMLNLIRNAVQATEGEGKLILRTRVGTNQVLSNRLHRLVALVEIEDNGPGVPEDIADTIFFPLVTGRKDGTGIGLPLAQELVTRHKGLIEFSSRPGKTVFSVSLPVLAAEDLASGDA